ncbi:ribose-phosphate diphosphokinase [Niabella sp. 22666]|uniref:ribose-phosphate diphosphokinase n=1 Tax=Niabella sp. 22666 TaxID=3453954 RepID=UPI003F835113
MTLNLDPQFRPWPDEDIHFESFVFAGGEPHIKIYADLAGRLVSVTHRINSFNDLGLVCIAADALSRMGAILDTLLIPYFPAARQDRVMVIGEALSVKVYANIINALGFKKVLVLDAHSEVTPALVDNCEVIPNYSFIKETLKRIGKPVVLVSPDGGALKKIYKLSEYLEGVAVVECGKTRDVATGKLSGFKVYADNLEGAHCLVVDDICDGGGTFIGLADALKSKGAGRLFLAVSHGIFSKGLDVLTGYYDHIYTTTSIREMHHEVLTQIPVSYGFLS